jgi:hypothetical protein
MNRIYGCIVFACLAVGTLLLKQRTKPLGKRRLTPDFTLLKKPAFATFFFSVAMGYFAMCALRPDVRPRPVLNSAQSASSS